MFETAMLLKFFGIIWTVIGVAMMTNPTFMRELADELPKSRAAQLLGGLFPLCVGAFIVVFDKHTNANGWTMFICLIGWLMLLGGIFRLWFNKAWVGMIVKFKDSKHLALGGVFATILGLVAIYGGYWG